MNTNFGKNFKNSKDNRLDLEYRQILYLIKQFIPYVNSNSRLTLYRCWLEKLSSIESNKGSRNVYLIELAKQIKDNTIAPPFDRKPTPGPLKRFTDYENISEIKLENNVRCPIVVDSSGNDFAANWTQNCLNTHNRQELQLRNNAVANNWSKSLEDDNSWIDLTDTSATSVQVNPDGSGDAEEKCVNLLAEENKNDTNKDQVDGEISLKIGDFVLENLKETIESLQIKFDNTVSENDELKCLLENQKSALSREIESKEQIEAKLKSSLERHEQEVTELKVANKDILENLENAFKTKLIDLHESYQLKMEEIKAGCEIKLAESKLEYENDKKAKDAEIYRLSEIIQQQCTRMSNEIVCLRKQVESCIGNNKCEDKITLLQKCVSKMDKLYHKSENDYLKHIEKLKQDLEFKDKVQLVQMKTQRAEIAMRCSAERQKQIDEIINNLEVKYIKMLEYHEKQVMESRRLDDERLTYFRELLEKNNIPFKIF